MMKTAPSSLSGGQHDASSWLRRTPSMKPVARNLEYPWREPEFHACLKRARPGSGQSHLSDHELPSMQRSTRKAPGPPEAKICRWG